MGLQQDDSDDEIVAWKEEGKNGEAHADNHDVESETREGVNSALDRAEEDELQLALALSQSEEETKELEEQEMLGQALNLSLLE